MIPKTLYFFIVISYLCVITQAFNLKSILFGDDNESAQEKQKHSSVPFGTPITKGATSKRSNANDCTYYVCEDTHACVEKPIDCPCPALADKKCYVGDWYTCVRGDENCDQLL
ncbi:hypothetical protein EDC96DRAFT_546119 [Choanephora cucurbitarum]|nr:hypothetical protein EDC96DRAFT_546119 [Choanephora cucurbitarum]